jgi:hypothetical protein
MAVMPLLGARACTTWWPVLSPSWLIDILSVAGMVAPLARISRTTPPARQLLGGGGFDRSWRKGGKGEGQKTRQ